MPSIASSFCRMWPVDQFVNATLTLKMIGAIWKPMRKTVPGIRNFSGIAREER